MKYFGLIKRYETPKKSILEIKVKIDLQEGHPSEMKIKHTLERN